jgi:hypothetical protein
MSTIKVDAISDEAGTGAPNFPNGLTGNGSALTGLPLPSAVAALTPAATVDIDLTSNDYFTLTLDQNTTLSLSNVATVDTFNLKLTGYAISTSLYDLDAGYSTGKSFDVEDETDNPLGVDISSDGFSFYVITNSGDTVFQYLMSVFKDPSTASYTGKSFGVGSQDAQPNDLVISPDGLRMYVIGATNNTIYQYTLSTAGDVSTASYANKSFSISSQGSTPTDIAFNSDETIMYMLSNGNNAVYQYTLSTAGDVSTASYASKSFSVASQETEPSGMAFSADGVSMFIVGTVSDTVFQYTLSTADDVSTASYASKSLSVVGAQRTPTGLVFSADGQTMFIVGTSSNSYNIGKYVSQFEVDGSVYATTAYPSAFKFPRGVVPAPPKGGEKNVLDFFTTDGGTTWNATQIGADYR